MACVFVGGFVGEVCEAEETGCGVPAGVYLGYKGYEGVGLGYAEKEHC